ncbi:Chaperone protein YscB [compost metagenome]
MKKLLLRLADCLALEPLVADKNGCYQVTIEGHCLALEPMGTQLTVRGALQGTLDVHSYEGQATLHRALEMVTRWGRQFPQALAISPQGQWVIEARLELNSLEFPELDRVLSAHVEILESLQPLFKAGKAKRHGGASLWRP